MGTCFSLAFLTLKRCSLKYILFGEYYIIYNTGLFVFDILTLKSYSLTNKKRESKEEAKWM